MNDTPLRFDDIEDAGPSPEGAHVITIGNEKGGSGKSTTSMHLVTGLLRMGFHVGSIDLDGRQKSLTRYIENRYDYMDRHGIQLPLPYHDVVPLSEEDSREKAQADEQERFGDLVGRLSEEVDFIIIDSPGSDTYLSRLGHAIADTLITPLNDSFVDFDLLGRIDVETNEIVGPSLYSELVWECRKHRAISDGGKIDWIVMRNRIAAQDARNKRRVGKLLKKLRDRIGFRIAPGFGERVIYRELFPNGLTLFDLRQKDVNLDMTMSHVAARQEVRAVLSELNIDKVTERLELL